MEKHQRLKLLRILCGFTQKELSGKSGIPQGSLAVMKGGRYGIAGESGVGIADVIGVPFDYLHSGKVPVDHKNHQAWILSLPSRSQHQQAIANDIVNLLPSFLVENGFDFVRSCELYDGSKAFLIGRSLNGKTVTEILFRCLLVAEGQLAKAIETAASLCPRLDSSGIPTPCFSVEALLQAFEKLDFASDCSALRKAYSEARSRKASLSVDAKATAASLQIMLLSMFREVRDKHLPDESLPHLAETFTKMSLGLHRQSPDQVE